MQLAIPDWNQTLLDDAGLSADHVPDLGLKLNDFVDLFRDCYKRDEQRGHAETIIKGFLSNLERKSIEPIALAYDRKPRAMQKFMQDAPINTARMVGIYRNELSSRVSDPDGMLNIDSTEFPKKGDHSPGVARQHCGRLGKTENCQSWVFVGYTGEKGYGLVDFELFLPQKWFTDEYRYRRLVDCSIPADVTFKSKVEMASEMLNEAFSSGLFPAKWIGCDSLFGNSKVFLDSLPEGCFYFADTHRTTTVFTSMPKVAPSQHGRGKSPAKLRPSFPPVPVSQIATDDSIPWEQVILGEGSKGPIIADVKVLRVIECRDGLPGEEIWLYIRRFADGKLKFSLSNAPADIERAELDRAATMRWPIEQCFEEDKDDLGMDHCEARNWNTCHRHIMFVLIAQLFLLSLRQDFKKNG